LAGRRAAASHAAFVAVAGLTVAAGAFGVGNWSDPPADLSYLTPPDGSGLRMAVPQRASADVSSPSPTVAATAAAPVAFQTHTVQAGDTLSGIAGQYGVDTQYLLWNNPELTANPDLLIVGANILVPGVDGIVYDVRLGDTINDIAAVYDIDPSEIVEFAPNDLDSPDNIIEGMVLVIPGGVPPPPYVPVEEPVVEPDAPAEDPPVSGPVPAGVGSTPVVQPPPVLSTSVSFIWPVAGTLWGGFGPRWGSFHKGIDIGASYGSSIVAAAAGQVILSTYSDNGYGSYVIVRHGDGSETLYAHMSERYVTQGQYVGQGEALGAVGCTGWCTGNHLHFEVHIGGGATDPIPYLP
jgi:murein DD-endopeptidase MepM/ murein hydrolase activator NlpD